LKKISLPNKNAIHSLLPNPVKNSYLCKVEKENNIAHKSGFVNIIGNPNVGKSTLVNILVGERMAIISAKPQTTRHRMIGIVSGENHQIVFSDTPGIIKEPHYAMQNNMNSYVFNSFEDADVVLFMTDMIEKYEEDHALIEHLAKTDKPLFLIINKTDLAQKEQILERIQWWHERLPNITETIPISALNEKNTEIIVDLIVKHLPEGPAYYPKDQLTDRSQRFFCNEIIREKILLLYKQEIPYSAEVVTHTFKTGRTKKKEPIVKILTYIFVMRDTQKSILIGKNGSMLKKLGEQSRLDIEKFLGKKVYLELTIKVRDNWRNDEKTLKRFGY